jgi:hypothetical protein
MLLAIYFYAGGRLPGGLEIEIVVISRPLDSPTQ